MSKNKPQLSINIYIAGLLIGISFLLNGFQNEVSLKYGDVCYIGLTIRPRPYSSLIRHIKGRGRIIIYRFRLG